MDENLGELVNRYERFIQERNWGQFHKPKNVSMAIAIEAGELMELFQWHDSLPPERIKGDSQLMDRIEEELADIMIYCLSMAIHLDMDPETIIAEKLADDEERFDSERSEAIRKELEKWQSRE